MCYNKTKEVRKIKNNFILLVGGSGSGKTEISKELYKRYGLSSIESYTTREPRFKNETGHIFIDDYEADEILDNEEIVGYTEFNGNRYFATAYQVEENEIYIIDKWGVEYFDEHYTGKKNIIVVYLDVDDQTRFERMMASRGTYEAAQRIKYDQEAFKGMKYLADYIVENYDLNNAVEEIYNIWKGNIF